MEDYDEAISLDPQLALAYANRAVANTLLGNDAAARRDADRAIQLGFDSALINEGIEWLKRHR